MSTWWNGRHAGLRSLWRDPWGFKSPRRHIKKILTNVSIFFIMKLGRALTLVLGFSASELRAKVFSLEETKFLKRKTVDPLNANEHINFFRAFKRMLYFSIYSTYTGSNHNNITKVLFVIF